MNSLSLSQEQKDQLLEMCIKLFPEYNSLNISIHDGECDLCLQNVVQFRNSHDWNDWVQIHWFELCALHLSTKLYNLNNRSEISTIELYRGNLIQNYHPVDYLYQEYLYYKNKIK